VLTARIAAEKRVLEERLDQLDNQANASQRRRPYPPVRPKFRNPDNPAETWSGRGRQPHWVVEQLRLGKRMEELKI
jgi:DNA-binding protein H-NS